MRSPGTITSVADDDKDGFYDDNISCTWEIRANGSSQYVQLYFLKMSLEISENCHKDYVKVTCQNKI